MRRIAETEFIDKSVPEHDEMRALITKLRALQPGDKDFDSTLFKLMNVVIHHVADEETLLLPTAERVLGDRLGELGAKMTKRRMQLTAPRTGEIAGSMAKSMSAGSLIVGATALLAGGYLLTRPHGWRDKVASRTPLHR
jgi:hypothetical protein